MGQNIFDILILAGFVQGIVSCSILFYRKENPSNKYLAWIILFVSLACLNTFLINSLEFSSNEIIVLAYCVPLIIIMPIGPLIYQYALSHSKSSRTLPRIHYQSLWIDLFPNILAIFFFLGMFMDLFDKEDFYTFDAFTDHYNKYVDIIRWASLTLYTIAAYAYLRKKKPKGEQWIFHFVLGFLIFELVWLAFLVPYLVPSFSERLLDSLNWYPLYVPLVVMIYWLGFTAMIRMKKTPASNAPDATIAKMTIEKLDQLMQKDKIYENPLLRLDDVVELTKIPQKTISASLNQSHKKTFKEYVNEFRVAEVKQKLIDPSFDHLTITGIAFECGFNSQATFQRTFKNLVGESPSTFRSRSSHKNTSQN